MNEGNSKEKMQASQNKGLQPLLQFIEDTVNRFIVDEFGDKYQFQFRGGDLTAQLDKIKVLKEEGEVFRTVNEIRAKFGLDPVPGGDVILNGTHIQAIGQEMQQEQFEYQKQQDRINRIMEGAGDIDDDDSEGEESSISVQDQQKGMNGETSNSNEGVGKDGQVKDQENTNSAKIGGKEDRKWDD
ncbi:MAG: phage portal protein [Tetragenococcus koreensis]|nr:phage portal protein [Tetragenococcus koreensis]